MAKPKKYKIKKDSHYSGFRVYPFYGRVAAKYEVTFDKNCIYDFNDEDQFDVNKLFGLSYFNHHVNSARFGWRADGDKIEISAYCYRNGDRYMKEICLIEPGKTYLFEIRNIEKYYEFELQDLSSSFFAYARISKPKTGKFGYRLFPYFGGNRTAPHDMEIIMKKIS